VKVRIGENWKNIFEEDAFRGEIWELAERLVESYLKIGEFGGLRTMSEYCSADATLSEDSRSLTAVGGVGGYRSRSWEASGFRSAGSVEDSNAVFMVKEREEDGGDNSGIEL